MLTNSRLCCIVDSSSPMLSQALVPMEGTDDRAGLRCTVNREREDVHEGAFAGIDSGVCGNP